MKPQRSIAIITFCLYLTVIAFLCFSKPDTLPTIPLEWFGLPTDKIAHFLMFCPFYILLHLIFITKKTEIIQKTLLSGIILLLGVGTAIGIEVIQAHLAYRSAEPYDLLADIAGLLFGAAFFTIINSIRNLIQK